MEHFKAIVSTECINDGKPFLFNCHCENMNDAINLAKKIKEDLIIHDVRPAYIEAYVVLYKKIDNKFCGSYFSISGEWQEIERAAIFDSIDQADTLLNLNLSSPDRGKVDWQFKFLRVGKASDRSKLWHIRNDYRTAIRQGSSDKFIDGLEENIVSRYGSIIPNVEIAHKFLLGEFEL